MSIIINKPAKSSTESSDIKTIVIEVMNDQLFLRNMIHQLSLENLVQKELNTKLPTHEKRMKEKVKTYVHDIISNKLKDFQRDTIPSCVAKELTNQITSFLNNHVQMNNIIEYHTTQINLMLTETARKTLADLVDEPQYHITTTAHLNSMDTKCELKILEIQNVLKPIKRILARIADFIEYYVRLFIIFITNFLPVKVIRDDKGVPFLYRYHIFTFGNDGPGLCIHRFVKSDPERGYHDHPWKKAVSFILCGKYDERILDSTTKEGYVCYTRNRWTFNYLDGVKNFHRVMVEEGKDVWTIFAFQRRSKTWGMVTLDGKYKAMSTTVSDQDGGWWNIVGKGFGIHSHIEHLGKVIATSDVIIIAESKVLLIKRGKEPFKGCWAFPGGRIEQKDKDILAAAYRELAEETQLTDIPLEYVVTIGNNTRDPRGFCITNVFVSELPTIPNGVRAGDDAVDYEWFDLDKLPEMAFDHKEILNDYLSY